MFSKSYISQPSIEKENGRELWNKIYDRYPEFRDKILLFFDRFEFENCKLNCSTSIVEQDAHNDFTDNKNHVKNLEHSQIRSITMEMCGKSIINADGEDSNESPNVLKGQITISISESKFLGSEAKVLNPNK